MRGPEPQEAEVISRTILRSISPQRQESRDVEDLVKDVMISFTMNGGSLISNWELCTLSSLPFPLNPLRPNAIESGTSAQEKPASGIPLYLPGQ